jgi:hypothetical protein
MVVGNALFTASSSGDNEGEAAELLDAYLNRAEVAASSLRLTA